MKFSIIVYLLLRFLLVILYKLNPYSFVPFIEFLSRKPKMSLTIVMEEKINIFLKIILLKSFALFLNKTLYIIS